MKTIITSILLIVTMTIHAQKTYLKVQKDENVTNSISYPPGTKFELRTKHNYIVLKSSETPRVFEIDDDYKLIVFPTYKKGKDVYKLKAGAKVILEPAKQFSWSELNNHMYLDQSDVNFEKLVTDSTIKKGKKNLVLTLSNGIKFTYKDEKYYATLYDDYIDIVGKYVVKTKLGTLKVSFNPTNGETWWVFEKSNQ